MVARAHKQVSAVNQLETEIIEECLKIQKSVEMVRAKIVSHLNNSENINGCLRGSTDDYIRKFDGYIAHLKSKLDSERKYWNRIALETQNF